MDEGRYEALVLAGAGLKRLGLEDRITEYLDPGVMIPAVCQGIIGVECREGDARTAGYLAAVNDEKTARAARAERVFLRALEGGCQVPLGCVTALTDNLFTMRGFVSDLEGKRYISDEAGGSPDESTRVGRELADRLLSRGGRSILEDIRNGTRDQR
jgi:hydroxymethylbilane synthase